jgi:hypothetical protein
MGWLAIGLVFASGGALIVYVFAWSDDKALRVAVLLAIAGCALLAIDSFLMTLCGLAENRSDLYNARCEGGVPALPLAGIPVLILLAVAAIRLGPSWRLLGLAFGGVTVAACVYVPWALLQV